MDSDYWRVFINITDDKGMITPNFDETNPLSTEILVYWNRRNTIKRITLLILQTELHLASLTGLSTEFQKSDLFLAERNLLS